MSPASSSHRSTAQWVASFFHEAAVTSIAVVGRLDVSEAFLVPKIQELMQAIRALSHGGAAQVLIVADTSGRLVGNLPVRLFSAADGSTSVVMTNAKGIAAVPALSEGTYEIRLNEGGQSPPQTFTVRKEVFEVIVVTVSRSQGTRPAAARQTGRRSAYPRWRQPASEYGRGAVRVAARASR